MKKTLLLAFLIILKICVDHVKSSRTVTLRILAWRTKFGHPVERLILSKGILFLWNWNNNSLHFWTFNWNLFCVFHLSNSLAPDWIWLIPFLGIISETVVSSVYFQCVISVSFKSFTIKINNHGPNFVPWGTPQGTAPHSETQSLASFTRYFRPHKKLMSQFITKFGIGSKRILLIRIEWSIRSKAFL